MEDERLFQAWKAAEAREDGEGALRCLQALVDARVARWRSGASLSPKDLYLIGLLIAKLQSWGRSEQALEYSLLGREAAGRHAAWECFFVVKGAQSCVEVLDFRSGQRILENLFGLRAGDLPLHPDEAAQRAVALAPPGATESERDQVRAEALLSIARWLAAVGQLGFAAEALARLQRMLEDAPEPPLPLPEIAILRAEMRFDRGEFASAESLLDDLLSRDGGAATRAKASVLRGQILQAQGRFTQALELFALGSNGADAPTRAQSILQRVHVLASLNRLSEAEDLLDEIEAVGTLPDTATIRMLRTLVREKRMTAVETFAGTPNARQFFALSEAGPAVEPAVSKEIPSSGCQVLERRNERVHADATCAVNLILLALHQDRVPTAVGIAVQFKIWAEQVDSPLIRAKAQYTWALAAYADGDVGAAERAATESGDVFRRLEMLPSAWAAQRVVGWCLERRGALASAISASRMRLAELQREIEHNQATADAALLRLNKWSTVDEEIAELCDDLAVGRTRNGRPPDAETTLSRILLLRRLGAAGEEWKPLGTPPRSNSPDLFDVMLETTRRRLAPRGRRDLVHRLTATWLPDDLAVLHLFVLPDRVTVFLSTSRGCTNIVPQCRVTKPELWQLVRKAPTALGRQRWRGEGGAHHALAEAVGLDRVHKALPRSVDYLAIVADDVLGHAPFAALPVGGEPLIARRNVCFLPSFAWSIGRRRPAGQARHGLAVAVEEAPRYAEQYPLLSHCLAEVEVVCGETQARWKCLSAEEATRAAALAGLAQAELAHFACHGDFFADAPRDSGLLLHEEWLRVTDIEDRRFKALNLVVLAACWGANTARLPGAVQVGLPSAFLQAGAAHVVASLWQVGDEAAIDLMRDFYRALSRSDPVRALAAAQRARIDDPPATWAGYVIFSDGVRARPYARLLLEGMTRLGF